MKATNQKYHTSQTPSPGQNMPAPHMNLGENGVAGQAEEIEQYLHQTHAQGSYHLISLSSSPARLQSLTSVLQDLQKRLTSRPQDYLLSVAHSAQVENPHDVPREDLYGAHLENLYRAGQKDEARKYIAAHIEQIDVNYDEGILLLRAAEINDPVALKLLLSKSPDPDWVFSAFEEAAYSGYAEYTATLINYLTAKGVDLREIKTKSAHG